MANLKNDRSMLPDFFGEKLSAHLTNK